MRTLTLEEAISEGSSTLTNAQIRALYRGGMVRNEDETWSPARPAPDIAPRTLTSIVYGLRRLHRPSTFDPKRCAEDEQPWPCETAGYIDEIDAIAARRS